MHLWCAELHSNSSNSYHHANTMVWCIASYPCTICTAAQAHPSAIWYPPPALHTTPITAPAAAFGLCAKSTHICRCGNASLQYGVLGPYMVYKTVAVHLRPMICCPTTPRNTPLATLAVANVPPRPMCQTTQLLPRCQCNAPTQCLGCIHDIPNRNGQC